MAHPRSRRGPARAVPDGDGAADATRVGGAHAGGFRGPGITNALRAVK
ncbi:hypothetical protein ACIBCP_06795 [Streptomyces sp. NPDC051287]